MSLFEQLHAEGVHQLMRENADLKAERDRLRAEYDRMRLELENVCGDIYLYGLREITEQQLRNSMSRAQTLMRAMRPKEGE